MDKIRVENPNRMTRSDLQKWIPIDSDLYKKIQVVKYEMLNKYLEEFPIAYRGKKVLTSEETKIQRTDPFGGGFHNWHAEISHWANCTRALVWTFYLNDIPDDEGETEFLYEKVRVKPKKGMGCIFPAAWPYQHRGNPVHSHSKYISTGWWYYPNE